MICHTKYKVKEQLEKLPHPEVQDMNILMTAPRLKELYID